ncbi:hypothetical protein DB31_4885 [Hyalangium minutum]|uniref:Uncharacterized protein n=1 Tax=Hyalangium minutum TaxID=394096 RepID=A0A085VZ40_9BACT|nr:hypothetical protein DB31_6731 [Hyalangium minutum]KFE60703.1 hypothetical protein DB31_4885 [Hyalangium minutum]
MGVAIVVLAWTTLAGATVDPKCDASRFAKPPGSAARWTVNVDGTVDVGPSPEPLIRFEADGPAPLTVSVEATGERQLLCGQVTPGTLYQLPLKPDDKSPQTVLTIKLSGNARNPLEQQRWDEQAEAVRSENLLRTTLIEAQAVDDALDLKPLREQMRDYGQDVSQPPPRKLSTDVAAVLKEAQARASCGPGYLGSPVLARCARAQEVASALYSLTQQMSRYGTAPADDSETARREFELQVAWLRLKPLTEGTFTPKEIQSYCAEIAPKLLWFDAPEQVLLNVIQVPFGGPDTTVHHIVWKRGKHTVKNQKPERAVSFVISSAPHGTDITVEAKERTGEKRDIAQILSGFAAIILRTLPAGPPLKGYAADKEWTEAEGFSEACKDLKPKPPSNIAPLEPLTSHAYVLAEMPDATVDILFCEGKTCPKDVSTITRAEVKPRPSASWALLAEFGLNSALAKSDAGWAMGAPRFESTGGASGPETLFELRYPFDARRLVTGSLLLGSRFCDDTWFVGAGPTLLVGSGGGALTQLNVRAGVRLRRGLYFTFGGGMRFVTVATDYSPGDLIAMPGAAGTAKAPEGFRTAQTVVPVVSAGLSFDLAVLGTAADSLVSVIGAGAKN